MIDAPARTNRFAVQLSLPFRSNQQLGLRHFVPFDCAPVTWLRQILDASGIAGKGLLVGPSGCGKTHLLAATCQQASRLGLSVAYVPLAEAQSLAPDILLGLEAHDLICIDDLQCVAGMPAWEQALFHCYNACDASATRLVFAAHNTPAKLRIGLPDLVSRLSATLIWQLPVLSDVQLSQAISLRAAAASFNLPQPVADYLLRRFPRDMQRLAALTDRLGELSLREHRRVTVPAVREWLEAGDLAVSSQP